MSDEDWTLLTFRDCMSKAECITPEILEDIVRLMFLSVVDMAR